MSFSSVIRYRNAACALDDFNCKCQRCGCGVSARRKYGVFKGKSGFAAAYEVERESVYRSDVLVTARYGKFIFALPSVCGGNGKVGAFGEGVRSARVFKEFFNVFGKFELGCIAVCAVYRERLGDVTRGERNGNFACFTEGK